jgi:hypothetical protein
VGWVGSNGKGLHNVGQNRGEVWAGGLTGGAHPGVWVGAGKKTSRNRMFLDWRAYLPSCPSMLMLGGGG